MVLKFKGLADWSKERFPIPGALVFAGFLFYVPYLFGILLGDRPGFPFIATIPGAFVIFLVLLHLRIFDEHKDFSRDVVAYPERVLSRGLITLRDLRVMLYAVLVIELGISLCLGRTQLLIWLCIMIWSLLMFFEFFAPKFLGRHMGLYLISHQLVIPFVALYGISMGCDITAASGTPGIRAMVIFIIGMMFAAATYEIARKTWSPEMEREHADSYSKAWGIRTAVIVNQVVAILAGTAFSFIYNIFRLDITFTLILVPLNLLFLVTGLMFVRNPYSKRAKLVMAGGILYMFGLFINSIVAFSAYP
ncbi:MAG: hypothetical protein AB2L11_02710 [Syntrophobacteraceae bacterium]